MRLCSLLLFAPAVLFAQPAAPQADPFAALRFLAGAWEGDGTGNPGAGTGTFSFTFELGGKALLRNSVTRFPAQGGRPAFQHDDLMAVYPEGGKVRALYLDNEGHTIRYTVTAVPKGVVFLSEPQPGPRFRLTYLETSPETVTVRFEMAPPATPEGFVLYLEGSSRRRRP
jgi:hypothetical protein